MYTAEDGIAMLSVCCAGRRGLARIVGLAAVEGARIRLAPLTMRHPLLDRSALQQQVLRHYTRAALNEGYKVLASVDILGASSSQNMRGFCEQAIGSVLDVEHQNLILLDMASCLSSPYIACKTFAQIGDFATSKQAIMDHLDVHCRGSAGDPKRLLHHLGLGFWSFLAEPTAGLLQVKPSARTRSTSPKQ